MPHFAMTPYDETDPESNWLGIIGIEYSFCGDAIEKDKHTHPVGHWSVVVEGTVEYSVGDRPPEIASGPWHAVWIPRNTKHGTVCKSDKARTLCILTTRDLDHTL